MKFKIISVVLLTAGNLICAQDLSLSRPVESFMLNESSLKDTVRLISAASGTPVVCTPDAAETEISFFFTSVSMEASLQAMCRSHGLWMTVSPEGVVILSTLAQHLASETVYAGDYLETITVKYPSVNDVCDTLKGLFRDRIVWERPDEDESDAVENIERALDRMDTLSDRSQFDIGENSSSSSRSSSRSRSSSSRTSSTYSEGEDLQQMKALQENEDFMREVMQKKLTAYVPELKGPSLIYLSALPEINTLLVRSSDRDAVQLVKEAVEKMDKPRGQVMLRVSVLSVTLDDSVETGVEWLFEDGDLSGGFADSAIQSLSSSISDYTAGTPVVSYVSDEVKARVTALAQKENTRELANPTLLVADNEAANVFIGTEGKYIDQIEPGVTTTTDGVVTTSDTTVTLEELNVGLSLVIAPRIHADRSVTLRIMQERSEIAANTRSIDVSETYSIEVQDIDQEVVTSTLVADDGSLVVLGGMISETELESDSGIPLLKDIPLLGRLFSTKSNQTVREELMVLIRPYVISVPGETAEVSRRLLDELNVDVEFPTSLSAERTDHE